MTAEPLRPLVIVEMDGGLIQYTHALAGVGVPEVIELDYDREGDDDEGMADFADRLRAAADAIALRGCDDYAAGYRDDAAAADRTAATIRDQETGDLLRPGGAPRRWQTDG